MCDSGISDCELAENWYGAKWCDVMLLWRLESSVMMPVWHWGRSNVLVFTNVFVCFQFQWGALADEGTFSDIRTQCNETYPTASGKCIGCRVLLCPAVILMSAVQPTRGEGSDRPSGPRSLLPKGQLELLTRRKTVRALATHVHLVPTWGMLGAAPPFLHTP
jgi:hypothetical protein